MGTKFRKPSTFRELIDCPSIQSNVEFPFRSINLPKMEKLYKLLVEYSNIINPFGNNDVKIKEQGQHFDAVECFLEVHEVLTQSTELFFATDSAHSMFKKDETGWFYNTKILLQKNRINGFLQMGHYYHNGNDGKPIDEVVHLYYTTDRDSFAYHPNRIDLRISLKTGLAWQTYKEEQAELATDEQIEVMITHLKISIKKIKNKIVRKMVSI